MRKLQYSCSNCGYSESLPEKKRNCPRCGNELNPKGISKKGKPKKESEPLATKRFIKKPKKKK